MTCVVLQTATKILQAMKIAREIHEKQSAQSPEVSTTQEDKTTTHEDKSSADTAMDVDEGEGAGFDADTGMVRHLELVTKCIELMKPYLFRNFQTWVKVGDVRESIHFETEEQLTQSNTEEEQEKEEQQPPKKKLKLQGHRVPVPDAIRSKLNCTRSMCRTMSHIPCCNVPAFTFAVPAGFESWKRSRQVVHVCLERVRISDPPRYKEIIARCSLRGKISRRRKMILKYRSAVAELVEDLEKAKVCWHLYNSKQ